MRFFVLFVLCAVVISPGCKKDSASGTTGGGATATDDKATSNDLKTIGLAFLNYCDVTKGNPNTSPLPADISDLEKYLGDNPAVVSAVKAGKYKVFWSTPTSQKIIACEKDAETKGGWVCFRMGDTQKLTAAEVQKDLAKK
jgi:hypothetical protein